jgi:hypothetical protein
MKSCPVSFITVDENGIRINAAFNAIIAITLIATQYLPLFVFLVLDFTLKSFAPKTSPISILSKTISKILHLTPHPTDLAPKIFAARLGWGMLIVALITSILGYVLTTQVILAIFLLCTTLEGTISFCVGCFIYQHLPNHKPQ